MNLKDSQTYNNLAKAFAGESMARNRYQFIEYGARQAGYPAIADIIMKFGRNEFEHARMFYTFIQKADDKPINNIDISAGYPFKEKWDLLQNFEFAASDEEEEAVRLYPAFADTAKKEGFTEIAALFNSAASVEKIHMTILRDIHDQLRSGTLYKKNKPTVWKCSHCGYENTGKEAWKNCPLCQAVQGAAMIHLTPQ